MLHAIVLIHTNMRPALCFCRAVAGANSGAIVNGVDTIPKGTVSDIEDYRS
jgi:hypothetical protein